MQIIYSFGEASRALDQGRATALRMRKAVSDGDAQALRDLLLERGEAVFASAAAASPGPQGAQGAFVLAVMGGREECARILLPFANPWEKDAAGVSAWATAVSIGWLVMADELIAKNGQASTERQALEALEAAIRQCCPEGARHAIGAGALSGFVGRRRAQGLGYDANIEGTGANASWHGGAGRFASFFPLQFALDMVFSSKMRNQEERAVGVVAELLPVCDPNQRQALGACSVMESAIKSGSAPLVALAAKHCDPTTPSLDPGGLLGLAARHGAVESLPALLAFTQGARPDWAQKNAFEIAVENGRAEFADALSGCVSSKKLKIALKRYGPARMPQAAAQLEAWEISRAANHGAKKAKKTKKEGKERETGEKNNDASAFAAEGAFVAPKTGARRI